MNMDGIRYPSTPGGTFVAIGHTIDSLGLHAAEMDAVVDPGLMIQHGRRGMEIVSRTRIYR